MVTFLHLIIYILMPLSKNVPQIGHLKVTRFFLMTNLGL